MDSKARRSEYTLLFFRTQLKSAYMGRIDDRIGVLRESIGELEPIRGGIIERLTHDIFTGVISPEQEENIAEQTLIAMEAQKVYQEDLEQIEDALMGQDILLGQEHDSGIETGRYLGDEELRVRVRVRPDAVHLQPE